MGKKRINGLERDLKLLRNETINVDLQNSIDVVLRYLHENNQTFLEQSNIRKAKPCLLSSLDCIKNMDIKRLREANPNLSERVFEYIENKQLIATLTSSDLSTFTVNELKVLYFILTETKDNHAMKSKKKEVVLNSVREAIAHYKRSSLLVFDQHTY